MKAEDELLQPAAAPAAAGAGAVPAEGPSLSEGLSQGGRGSSVSQGRGILRSPTSGRVVSAQVTAIN